MISQRGNIMGAGRRILARLGRIGLALTVMGVLAACASDEVASPKSAPRPAAPAAAPTPTVVVEWRDFFKDVSKGAILVNIDKRWLMYWEPGGRVRHAFPIAVPLNDDLERTGVTKVVRKRENPDWRPTPSMRKRMPELPPYIGPGPNNPLGERALYLGWRYYAIHGTNNPASIGTRATSGCFRMRPDDVLWLYDRVGLGTPVRVIDDLPPETLDPLALRALKRDRAQPAAAQGPQSAQ